MSLSKKLKYWKTYYRALPDGAQEDLDAVIAELEEQEVGLAKRPRKNKAVSKRPRRKHLD